MMLVEGCYTVLDAKSGGFHTPFFAPTDGHALRSFQELVTAPDTIPGKHPEDFSLHRIGSFNSETAEFTPMPPKNLTNGAAIVAQKGVE